MAKVTEGWLASQTHKLIDMNDLILLQHCMKEQEQSDWFWLPNNPELYGSTKKNYMRRRKSRLVKSGVLEIKFNEKQNCHVYRLAGNE